MLTEEKIINMALRRYRLGTVLVWPGVFTRMPFIGFRGHLTFASEGSFYASGCIIHLPLTKEEFYAVETTMPTYPDYVHQLLARAREEGQPGEPADWVKQQARLFSGEMPDEMLQDLLQHHRWTRQIPPPAVPKHYDPNEPPIDPTASLGAEDDE